MRTTGTRPRAPVQATGARLTAPVRTGPRRTTGTLMAAPVLKLFVHDTFLLERGYRVAAFISLGGLLLAVGMMYQRYSQAVRGFLFGRPAG